MKKKRVLFISSTGGHFNELQQLQPLFEKYDYKNKDASWKDSKDAIQRGMQKLRGSDPSRPPHMLKK